MASPALGSVSSGSAPEPIWLAQAIASTLNARAEPHGDDRRQRAAASASISACASAQAGAGSAGARPAGRDRDRACSVASSAASRTLSRRSARFIGFLLIRAISSLRPTMKPACGPPSSLSPEKVTRSAPSATASATVGSCARSEAREIDERAGAEIVHQRHAVLARERGELARRHLRREALDAVVRGVHLEDQPGLGADRARHSPSRCVRLVVPTSTSFAPAPRHDVGHAERAADLDQLAARDDRLAALAPSVLSTSSTAAALLLTTVASSAPVSSQSRPRT